MKSWQRQNTIVTNLHPPKSERVIPLYREGKLMLGEVTMSDSNTVPSYSTLVSSGIWPVYGKDAVSADFKASQFIVRDDGFPIQTLKTECEGLAVTAEAFCNVQRRASAFIRYSVTNTCGRKNRFGLMVRTGLESKLVFEAPDIYKSYAPDVLVWKKTAAEWMLDGDLVRNGEYFLKPLAESGSFDAQSGILWFELSSGEKKDIFVVLGKGEIPDGSYEENREKALAYYEALSKRFSVKGEMDTPMVRSLIFQLLQCFAMPKGKELTLCRQGGLQRRMWPFEAMYALRALDVVGDFDDFVESVIDLYFDTMQTETGEIVPLGIYWALATAVSIRTFADHAVLKGKDYYKKYRDRAMAGFDFIKRSRVSDDADPNLITGLFAPRRSCDAENVLQSWTLTDAQNIMAIRQLARAAKQFDDPRADEIAAEYRDYLSSLRSCYERLKAVAHGGKIRITNYLPGMGDETKHPFRAYAGTVASILELPAEDVFSIIESLKVDGSVHEGLYNRMPDHYRRKDGDGAVREWYTSLDEFYWFDAFAQLGMWEKCSEVVESTCKYAMTNEFYMTERFHERDPWFVPWSPNASASGRLLIMLDRLQKRSQGDA